MNQIAILYPGALGAPLGKAFIAVGYITVTCLRGRSALTCERALAANFAVVHSLAEVAKTSDMVISLVSPSEALEVARHFAACAADRCSDRVRNLTYVEANSVAPRTKAQIAKLVSSVGMSCVDGAFLGPANQIGADNLMLLSGPRAKQVAQVFGKVIEVRMIGNQIGQASSLKMTMAVLTKALPALFLEAVGASAKLGQLETTIGLMRRLYPGVLGFLQRTLPTYPTHIARRVFELTEARDLLRELGHTPVITEAAIAVLERIRLTGLGSNINCRFDDVLRAIGDGGLPSN